MAAYQAPVRDMLFVLDELFPFAQLQALPGGEDLSLDLAASILEEAAKITEEMLFPLNRSGDEEGCRIEAGVVTTPKGFREAYRTYREGGWTTLASDPAYGGQGLPLSLALLVEEMVCSANISFSLYPGLTHGAYKAISAHASEELRQAYLPKMVEGIWSGTMCLTEPHCGTDLGLLRTKATPRGDGSYDITGTKIFITAGEQDLTENIIHLVLARLPDAPKGTKGISLFLVPKFLPDANGNPGTRNPAAAGAIEHKMGIKASATCVMNFDGAQGWLVGEPHAGMRAMFTMMNSERLAVGIQGLGIAEAAYQGAVVYAKDRLQGRAIGGATQPDKAADPLLVHPDVRRMLLTQRAFSEGCRALGQWVARALDVKERSEDAAQAKEADNFVALLTPVVKALFTDLGFEAANLGVQVFGGHGFIREHGMEQLVRDCRIAQLYEGTNGIQALDLVGRKLNPAGGVGAQYFFAPVKAFLAEQGEASAFTAPLAAALARLEEVTAFLVQDGVAAATNATLYLHQFGLTALAYVWARSAAVAQGKLTGDEAAFYQAKIATARFFFDHLLPRTEGLARSILAGGESVTSFPDAAF